VETGRRLDLPELLSSLVEGRLPARHELSEPDWSFWERRNLNIHRVVGLWTPRQRLEASELKTEARSAIARHFHRSWWRGLAFGVVAAVRDITLSPSDLQELIDGRENVKGTWQWVVLVSDSKKAALGVHTWIEGYLSPVYRDLLGELQGTEYQVTSVRKEKDGLLKFLTAAKPRAFPNFRNEIQDKRPA
jgi:hypothetical protein